MSGLFAALKELETKYGLPPRKDLSGGAGLVAADSLSRSLPKNKAGTASPSQSNFSSVPVPDTLGAAGNILSGIVDGHDPASRHTSSASEVCTEIAISGGPESLIGSENQASPAQDPFTPAKFRAMIRQQCLGEAR